MKVYWMEKTDLALHPSMNLTLTLSDSMALILQKHGINLHFGLIVLINESISLKSKSCRGHEECNGEKCTCIILAWIFYTRSFTLPVISALLRHYPGAGVKDSVLLSEITADPFETAEWF